MRMMEDTLRKLCLMSEFDTMSEIPKIYLKDYLWQKLIS